jgi:hypothetical protein
MKLTFEALPETALCDVTSFLRSVFHAPSDALFLQPEQMRWKCWQARADWPEPSRSYGYRDETGELVAHAVLWPFRVLTVEGVLSGAHPIDWAAGKKVPAAGALLLRQVRTLTDVSCCIGGTEIAQKVIAQTGYKATSEMTYLVKPVRPLRQLLTHQWRNWKLPARFARNLAWSFSGAAAPQGWTAERIAPVDLPDHVLPKPDAGLVVAERTAAMFTYLMECPTAPFELYVVRKDSSPCGYFLLSFAPGQARIADAWIVGPDGFRWQALYALAIQAALENQAVAEVLAAVTLEDALSAAIACGFRRYGSDAVMLFDPKKRIPPGTRMNFQMIDNDRGFMQSPGFEYVS